MKVPPYRLMVPLKDAMCRETKQFINPAKTYGIVWLKHDDGVHKTDL